MSAQGHIDYDLPSLEADLEWLCAEQEIEQTAGGFSTPTRNHNILFHQTLLVREDIRIDTFGRTYIRRIGNRYMVMENGFQGDQHPLEHDPVFNGPKTPMSALSQTIGNGSFCSLVRHLTFSEFDENGNESVQQQAQEHSKNSESKTPWEEDGDGIHSMKRLRRTSSADLSRNNGSITTACDLACLEKRISLAKKAKNRKTPSSLATNTHSTFSTRRPA